MTAELLTVHLGSLFAAGHAPAAVADWTWPQVELAARGVHAYHLDFVAQVMSGKSPTLEAARAAGPPPTSQEAQGQHEDAEVRREMARLGQMQLLQQQHGLMGSGVGLKVTRGAAGG